MYGVFKLVLKSDLKKFEISFPKRWSHSLISYTTPVQKIKVRDSEGNFKTLIAMLDTGSKPFFYEG